MMERQGLPMLNHVLQHTLRGLCCDTQWVYAVFWRILPRNYPPPKWENEGRVMDRSKGNQRNCYLHVHRASDYQGGAEFFPVWIENWSNHLFLDWSTFPHWSFELFAYVHYMPAMGYYDGLGLGNLDTVRLLVEDEATVTVEIAASAEFVEEAWKNMIAKLYRGELKSESLHRTEL